MGIIEWERDVEYFELDEVPQPTLELPLPFVELDYGRIVEQDDLILYGASERRSVRIRVLGFSATSPMVQAVIKYPRGVEKIRKGELVGCRYPDDVDIIPGVLRTYHVPVLREIGRSAGVSTLPIPIKGLRTLSSSRKLK